MQRIDLNKLAGEAVEKSGQDILQLNRDQMQRGLSPENDTFKSYAWYSYAKMKADRGSRAPFGIPDLLLTGAFQSGMQLVFTGKEYFIFSTDKKNNDLAAKYRPFGLNKKNQQTAKEKTTRQIAELYKKATGLK